jgi:adenosine deaminase
VLARDGHIHLEATHRLRLLQEHGDDTGRYGPPDIFAGVLASCLRDTAAGGAREALLRLNPLSWARRGIQLRAQCSALSNAQEAAETNHNLIVAFYVTLKHEADASELRRAVEFAVGAKRLDLVAGIDVSRSYDIADPCSVPSHYAIGPALHHAVEQARDGGLDVAFHCGWYDNEADLEAAIELGARRVGHAVPLAGRPDLVVELVQRGIVVELCPTAHLRRQQRSIAVLPVVGWLAAGLSVDVGTDHPLGLGTTYRREADLLRAAVPTWDASRQNACVGP